MHMRHVAFRVILFCCVILVSGPASSSNMSDQIYLAMVERTKGQPEGYDFKILRGVYEQTDFFTPEMTRPGQDLPLILEGVDRKEPGAETYLEKYISSNFPLAEVHMLLLSWYEKKGEMDKAAYHAWAARGLLNVMLKYNDGKGAGTAYRVLNRGEIYIILTMNERTALATRQWANNVLLYEIIKVRNPETGQFEDVWFDLTPMQPRIPE